MTSDWKVDFSILMSSGLGYVVLEVDGAGSFGRGQKIMGAVKQNLGQAEVTDQIAAARHVIQESEIVDPARVAVSGVSYGGYVVGRILSERSENKQLFRCGVAVAPVVDWRFYGESHFGQKIFVAF